MALSIAKVNSPSKSYVSGDHVFIHVDVTGDASYPTGGWPLTPTNLGLSEIHHLDCTQESSGTRLAAYDYVNQKLKTFSALGTETANATDLHTVTWRVFVSGKGQPTIGVVAGT